MSKIPSLVFFLGYMGCGKSTVGCLLAKRWDYNYIDLDEMIEKEEGTSVSNIFAEKGETYFRSLETQMLKKLEDSKNTVISLGGGTPCFHQNMNLINQYGTSIWMYADSQTIFNRLKSDTSRPILQDKTDTELLSFIQTHSESREEYYSQADYMVNGAQPIHILIDQIENLF